MTELEEHKAARSDARAAVDAVYDAARADARADAWAAVDAYEAEIKRIQKENSND